MLTLVASLAGATCNQNLPGTNAPVANAGADRTVSAGESVTLDGSASSDPDGDALTFSWRQAAGTPVTLSDAAAAITSFTAPDNGTTVMFELTVSDGANSSVARVNISVLPVDPSAQITELSQGIPDDPAATGGEPTDWLVPTYDWPVRPPEEGEIGEFTESYEKHDVIFTPVVKEDLAPGAARTVQLQLAGPSGLNGVARWIGTASPLAVSIALDGVTLVTGTPYQMGTDRGGAFLQTATTAGGLATLSVTNTTDITVKVELALGRGNLN